MLKKLTSEFLEKYDACYPGFQWFSNEPNHETLVIIYRLIEERRHNWCNWLIVRLMNRKQRILYAVYAAELVLSAYGKNSCLKFSKQAIEAAKKCIDDNSEENSHAASYATEFIYYNSSCYWAALTATFSGSSHEDNFIASIKAASSAASSAASDYTCLCSTLSTTDNEKLYDQTFEKILKHGISLLRKEESEK